MSCQMLLSMCKVALVLVLAVGPWGVLASASYNLEQDLTCPSGHTYLFYSGVCVPSETCTAGQYFMEYLPEKLYPAYVSGRDSYGITNWRPVGEGVGAQINNNDVYPQCQSCWNTGACDDGFFREQDGLECKACASGSAVPECQESSDLSIPAAMARPLTYTACVSDSEICTAPSGVNAHQYGWLEDEGACGSCVDTSFWFGGACYDAHSALKFMFNLRSWQLASSVPRWIYDTGATKCVSLGQIFLPVSELLVDSSRNLLGYGSSSKHFSQWIRTYDADSNKYIWDASQSYTCHYCPDGYYKLADVGATFGAVCGCCAHPDSQGESGSCGSSTLHSEEDIAGLAAGEAACRRDRPGCCECDPGFVFTSDGNGEGCKACPLHTYHDDETDTCVACPMGTYTLHTGAPGDDFCYCRSGYGWNGGSERLVPNNWERVFQFGRDTTPYTITCEECESGKYRSGDVVEGDNYACVPCPEHGVTAGTASTSAAFCLFPPPANAARDEPDKDNWSCNAGFEPAEEELGSTSDARYAQAQALLAGGGHGIKVGCIPASAGGASAGSVYNKLQCRGYSKGGIFPKDVLAGDANRLWPQSEAYDYVDLCPEATSEWVSEVEWDSSRTMPDGFYQGIYGEDGPHNGAVWPQNKLGCLVAITASHPLLSNVRASIESWRGDWRSFQNYKGFGSRIAVKNNNYCYHYDDDYGHARGNACCPQHFSDADSDIDAWSIIHGYQLADYKSEYMYRGVQFLNFEATGSECDIVWACEDLQKFTDTSVVRGCVKTFFWKTRWPQDEFPYPEITGDTWRKMTQFPTYDEETANFISPGGIKPDPMYDYEDSVSNSDPNTYVHAMMVGGFKNNQFVSGYVGFAESRDNENQFLDYFCRFTEVSESACTHSGISSSDCYDEVCTTTQRNPDNVLKSFKFRFTPVAAVCAPCGVGFYKIARGNEACVACPDEMTTSGTGSSSVNDCHCNAGYTGADGGVCALCVAGKYKTVVGAGSLACTTCPANSHSPGEGATAVTACLCNAGFTGPDGGGCAACAAGKYKAATGSEACSSCPENSHSPTGSDVITDCQCNMGYNGPNGGTCSACGAGKYKDAVGSASCTTCPSHTHSPAASGARPDCVCNAGYTGPNGGSCSACAAGKYKAATGNAACSSCPGNSHSPGGSDAANDCQCNVGYSGPDGGTCTACSPGTIKPSTGPASCTECAKGKFTGVSARTVCDSCVPGKYADATGLDGCDNCPDHSTHDVTESQTVTDCSCNAGYTGADGSACSPCATGKYKAVTQAGSAPCDECAAGTYQPNLASTSGCTTCGVQTYSLAAAGSCEACAANSQAPAGSDAATDCICNRGYSGPDGGPCGACQAGTYKDQVGSGACVTCGAGEFSAAGSISCGGCGADTYAASGAGACSACPADSQAPAGSSVVEDCECNAGYTGPDGGSCEACGVGFYKPLKGSNPCIGCAPGKYQDETGQTECDPCGQDTYSYQHAASCIPCPPPASAPAGSDNIHACLCNAGYTGTSTGGCVACAVAKYKDGAPSDAACSDCSAHETSPEASEEASACVCNAGYTFEVSSASCVECAAGYVKDVTGDHACSACPAGEYAESTKQCALCLTGTYNDQPAQPSCQRCPPNSTTAEAGAAARDECVCQLGFRYNASMQFRDEVREVSRMTDITAVREVMTVKNTCNQSCEIDSLFQIESWQSDTEKMESINKFCRIFDWRCREFEFDEILEQNIKIDIIWSTWIESSSFAYDFLIPAREHTIDQGNLAQTKFLQQFECCSMQALVILLWRTQITFDIVEEETVQRPSHWTDNTWEFAKANRWDLLGQFENSGQAPVVFFEAMSETLNLLVTSLSMQKEVCNHGALFHSNFIPRLFENFYTGPFSDFEDNFAETASIYSGMEMLGHDAVLVEYFFGSPVEVCAYLSGKWPWYDTQIIQFDLHCACFDLAPAFPVNEMQDFTGLTQWPYDSYADYAEQFARNETFNVTETVNQTYAVFDSVLWNVGCVQCPAGTAAGALNSSFCAPCGEGAVSGPGSSQCVCGGGYTGPDGEPCAKCEKGKFKASTGSEPCEPCAAGFFNGEEGKTECEACAAGFVSGVGADVCDVCERGTFETSNVCEPCAAGYFNGEEGKTECEACAAGMYAAATGAAECDACALTEWSAPGAAACVCAAGYTGESGACVPCAADTFKSVIGNSTCLACPVDTRGPTASAQYAGCVCDVGRSRIMRTPSSSALETATPEPSAGSRRLLQSETQWCSVEFSLLCEDCYPNWPRTIISSSNGVTLSGCQDECANEETCIAIWFDQPRNGWCGLYSSYTGYTYAASNKVYTKEMTPHPTYYEDYCTSCYIDHDLTNTRISVEYGVSDVSSCKTLCDQDCNCIAILYRSNQECSLYSAITFKMYDDAPFSGHYKRVLMLTTSSSTPEPTTSSSTATFGTTPRPLPWHVRPVCELCAPGTFKDFVGDEVCVDCPAHTHSNAGGEAQAVCICNAGYTGPDGGPCGACAAGKYKSVNGSDACTQCPEGTQLPATGSVAVDSCIGCSANTYSAADSSECTACPPLTVSRGLSAVVEDCRCVAGHTGPDGGPCAACAAGTYKAVNGSTRCVSCPDDTHSRPAALSEVHCICNAGFTGPDDAECDPCARGTYKPLNGSGACTACPPHTLSELARTQVTDCICNAGFEGPDGGACEACATGRYKDVNGSSACVACPAHSFSLSVGAAHVEACECVPGFTPARGAGKSNLTYDCESCAAGTYKEEVSSERCTACPPDSWGPANSTNRTGCVCNAGYTGHDGGPCEACVLGKYKNASGSHACTDCLGGFTKTVAAVSESECACMLPGEILLADGNCSQCGESFFTIDHRVCLACPASSTRTLGEARCECVAGLGGDASFAGGVCEFCEAGTFKAVKANANCTACPGNSTSPRGSVARTQCECLLGFAGANGGECRQCAPGSIEVGDECVPCQANAWSLAGAVECACVSGFFMLESGECLQCGPGTFSRFEL